MCPLPLQRPAVTPRRAARWAAWGVLAVTLAGCTTLEDFQKMSPAQRAQKVCSQQAEPLDRQIRELRNAVADVNAAMAAGYRLHRSCQDVERFGPKQVTCTTTNNGPASTTRCTEFRPRRLETVCVDQPVAISFELERDKLNSYTAQLTGAEGQRNTVYGACFQEVVRLSPEEAFARFR